MFRFILPTRQRESSEKVKGVVVEIAPNGKLKIATKRGLAIATGEFKVDDTVIVENGIAREVDYSKTYYD